MSATVAPSSSPAPRRAERRRATKETEVEVVLSVDGTGHAEIATGLPFFDHMLSQLAVHGGFVATLLRKSGGHS